MKLKKILFAFIVLIVVLFAAILAAPFFFKDQIKTTIDEQIAANVNADVLFDIDNFSLSLLTNFPNLTTSIKDLKVIGRNEFVGEALFAIDRKNLKK